MGKQDPILSQIAANRKRYLEEEKFKKKKIEEEKTNSAKTPQSVLDGTDPDYGAPEGFQDYTTFGSTREERSDSSKKLIEAEIKAVEEAKKQQQLEQQKKLAVWNDPAVQEQFRMIRDTNAMFNQPGGQEVDPNSLAAKFPGIEKNVMPGAPQYELPQAELDPLKMAMKEGGFDVPGEKKISTDEKAKNKVTNFLIDVGLYNKPIAENLRGVLDPIVAGKEKIVKANDDIIYNRDVLRGSANLVTGTLQTAMNMIPAVVGLNATMPIMNQVGGSVAEGLGFTKEQGEKVTGIIAPFLFGKWIGASSLASFGVDEGLTATGVLDGLSPEDQVIARELIGHLAFFGTLLGGKAITKAYLDPALDKAFPYTRGMKADLNDPKVTRIMNDYAERFNEKKAEFEKKQQNATTPEAKKKAADDFNKWAQDEIQKIIQNEKPAFFRNVKKDLDNLKEQRRYQKSQSKEPVEKFTVDPNQVNQETGFTDFKFDEVKPEQNGVGKQQKTDVKAPETDLGKIMLKGQEIVSPQRSIEAPKGIKPIITPAPGEKPSGEPIITPPAKLKQLTPGEDPLKDVDRSKIKIKISDDKLIDLKSRIEKSGGKLVGIGGSGKPKYDLVYYDPIVDHPDATPTTFTIPMDYFRKDPDAINREVKRLNKKYIKDLNKIQEKKKAPAGKDLYERKARFVSDNADVITGVGKNLKNEKMKENFIEIDGYGRIPAQSFINKLIEKGRLPNEMRKKITQRFSDEYYTELLNKNIDLFPKQFEEKKKAEIKIEPAIKPASIPPTKIKVEKDVVEKKAEKPAPPKKVKRKVVSKGGSEKQQIVDTKLSDIVKSEKDFQGRSEAFSGESFKRIVTARIQSGLDEGTITDNKAEKMIKAANDYLQKNNPGTSELTTEDLTPENTFSWNDFGQVLLWEDPKAGLKLLSGHSRTAAAEFLKDYFDEFQSVPSMIERGISFEAAQKKALQSNIRGTAESLLSHVKKIQVLRDKGKTEKEIKAVAKTFYGSDANKIVNMSMLDPDGYTIAALKLSEKDPTLNTIANWIGNVRSNFPQLTTDHENEIFEWLNDPAIYIKTVKNMTQLNDLIERRVNNIAFDPAAPLNLKNAKGKGGNLMQDYERDLADKRQQLNNAKADLEKARGKWAAKGLEGKDLEDKIAMDNAYVNRIEAEYQKLLLKKNAVIDAEMDQGSLFNIKSNSENKIRKIKSELELEQQAMFPDEEKLKLLNNQIRKIEMEQAQAEAQLGIQADLVKKEFSKLKKEFDIKTAELPELKIYQLQLESQGDKLSIDDAKLLDKINRRIKGIESVGEQENLFEPEQGSLFSIKDPGNNYPMSADDLPSLGIDVVGRNIPNWKGAIVYHSTDPKGSRNIDKKGFRILDDNEQSGYYGKAVSFTPDYEYTKNFGDHTLTVKLSDDIKILNLNDQKDWDIYAAIIKGKRPEQFMTAVVDAGYDGIYDVGAGDLFLGSTDKVKIIKNKTDLPAFKSWFGKSKIVDANGDPRIVYHGTNSRFSVVNMKKGAQGLFWFSSDPNKITSGDAGATGTSIIMDLYVKIENPAGWNEYSKYGLGQLQDLGYDGVILDDGAGGFDGFVFEGDQIKSASKNLGTYASGESNIHYAMDDMRDLSGMSKQQRELTRLRDYKKHLELSLDLVKDKDGVMPVVKGVSGSYSPSYFRKEIQIRNEIDDINQLIKKLEASIPKTVRLDNQVDMFSEQQTEAAPTKQQSKKEVAPPPTDEPGQLELFNIKKQTGLRKVKSFRTEEGNFETYDINISHPGRPDMFTLYKGKDGYVVRNVVVPEDKQRNGLATEFYIAANQLSIEKTGQPLKSSPSRKIYDGSMVTELTDDGVKLWESFVAKGYAEKLGDKQYRFFGGDDPQMIEADDPDARNLITVHNLASNNLLFADKMKGLAMPSMAIVKKQMGFDKYGEISLIADPSLIDPEKGGRVFNRDIYSPTYPVVYRHVNKKLLWKKLEALRDALPPELADDSNGSLHNLVEKMEKESYEMIDLSSYNDFLDYSFLNSIGKLPNLVYKNEPLRMDRHLPEFKGQYKVAKELVKKYPLITEKYTVDPVELEKIKTELYNKSKDYYDRQSDKDQFLDRNAREIYNEESSKRLNVELRKFTKDYNEAYLETFSDDPEVYGVMKEHYGDRDLDKWYFDGHGIMQDIKRLLNPKKVLNPSKYRESIDKVLKPMKEEFQTWVQDYFADVHGEEYLKAGKTKIPHTLQNAVDIMGNRIKGVEKTMIQGLGKSATISAKEFTSLADIKKSKDRLVTEETFHQQEEAMKNKFMKLADSLSRYYKYQSEFGFERLDNLSLAVGKIAASRMDDSKISSLLYRGDYRSVPDWYYDDIREVARLMKNMPTAYFEAKDGDIVRLNQFAGALIPKNVSPKVKQVLEKNSIKKIIEYDPDVKGDRIAKLNEFTDQFFNIEDDMDKFFGDLLKSTDKRIENLVDKNKKLSQFTRDLATKYKNDSTILRDTELNMYDDPLAIIATLDEWINKYHYDPRDKQSFQLIEKDEPDYEPGQIKYRGYSFGKAIQPGRANGWKGKIDFYGTTDMATILEEVVHIFQAEVKRLNPKLAKAIQVWESEARKFAAEQGIIIPLDAELFAKSFVAQAGHTIADNTIYIHDEIFNATVQMLNHSRSGEKIFDKYLKPQKLNVTAAMKPDTSGHQTATEQQLGLFNIRAPGEDPGTPRMDKYVKKVLESMPEKLAPEKEARLSELKKFKELSSEEKKELADLKKEKADLLATDPYEKHRLSTLISMKIRNLRTGYKVGAAERQAQLTDLKKDIAAYARLILPRADYRKSEITPLLTDLAKAKDLDGTAKAFTRIRDIERKVRKRILIGKINKIIRNADRTKGDPDFVIAIKNIRRMKAEDIEKEIAKIYERAANRELTDEEDQFLYLLQRFSDIKNRSVDELEDLYKELQEAIIEGRSRRKEWLAKEKARMLDLKEKTIFTITGGKQALSDDRARAEGLDKEELSTMDRLSDIDSMMHSWEWMMDKLSKHDKTTTPLRSFLNEYFGDKVFDARNVEDKGMRENLKLLREKMMQIYGTSKHDLTKRLSSNSERRETLATRVHVVERDEAGIPTKTENVRLVMSQNEAAYMLMVHEDPQLAKTFEKMGYTEDTWTKLKAFVDPKVMQWAKWQLEEFYPAYYQGVNEVYKQMRGVDLQFNKKYMPISRDVAQTVLDQEFLGDNLTEHVSIFNGHLQPRVSNTHAIRIQDIDRVLMEHIIEMEHFKAFAAIMKDLRGVFGNREVSKAIKQYHSATALQVVNRFINDFARGGVDRRLTVNLLDKIRANFAKAVIGLNPVVFIKQLTAIPAYLMDIPAKDFVTGVADFATNPIGKAKFLLKNSETLKSRYSKGWERDIILAMQRARKTTAKELSGGITFTDIIMSLTKFGDAGAIFPGGWATYKYHLKKQMAAGKDYEAAKKIAIKEFEKSTNRSQAAGSVEDLGEIQRQGSWAKMWTLFKTAPKQYYSNMSGALRNLVFKRGKKSENLKRLFVAHVLLPQIFQWTANGFEWRAGSQLRALAIGSLNGILIAGDILETALMAIMGDTIYAADDTPLTAISQDVYKALKQLNKYVESFDKDAEDLLKTIDELASAFSKFFGVPYDPVKKVGKGIKEFSENPDETNALRLVGFSDYSLKDPQAEKSDTLKMINEKQNRLNKMKQEARKTMDPVDIEKAKQYERDLKKLKEKSTDWKKKQADDKLKDKNDPFKKPKKPKTPFGQKLLPGLK